MKPKRYLPPNSVFTLLWKYVEWITLLEVAWRNSKAKIQGSLFLLICIPAVCWHTGIDVWKVALHFSLPKEDLYQSSDFNKVCLTLHHGWVIQPHHQNMFLQKKWLPRKITCSEPSPNKRTSSLLPSVVLPFPVQCVLSDEGEGCGNGET